MMLKLKLRYLATSFEELTHWKRLQYWGGLEAGGEGDDREWDGWMASLTWWTWVWVNSGSWWWTGRPGVLQFMGSQKVGHDWATELNWTEPENYSLAWQKINYREKGVRQGCILSSCLFNLYAEYIMRNAGLEETQLESRLLGEISITSYMQITPPLWQKVKRN